MGSGRSASGPGLSRWSLTKVEARVLTRGPRTRCGRSRRPASPAPSGAQTLALARMASAGASPAETAAWLARDAVDSLPQGALAQKLAAATEEARPLRVKLGIDATAPDIHLGHAIVLQRLRDFQDAGHLVVLIIGDYTGRVGDPSGRSATRPVLSGDEIDANAATFRE